MRLGREFDDASALIKKKEKGIEAQIRQHINKTWTGQGATSGLQRLRFLRSLLVEQKLKKKGRSEVEVLIWMNKTRGVMAGSLLWLRRVEGFRVRAAVMGRRCHTGC